VDFAIELRRCWAELPVVLMSSREPADLPQGLTAAFLPKPFGAEALLRVHGQCPEPRQTVVRLESVRDRRADLIPPRFAALSSASSAGQLRQWCTLPPWRMPEVTRSAGRRGWCGPVSFAQGDVGMAMPGNWSQPPPDSRDAPGSASAEELTRHTM
jgi:hypothetical protein